MRPDRGARDEEKAHSAGLLELDRSALEAQDEQTEPLSYVAFGARHEEPPALQSGCRSRRRLAECACVYNIYIYCIFFRSFIVLPGFSSCTFRVHLFGVQ